MGQNSKKDNGAQNKPAMEKVELAKLVSLPAGATDAEREVYIKAQHDSSVRCKERHLVSAWYIGRELPRLKATKRLQGAKLNAYCKEKFGFGVRQAQDCIKIAEHFSSKADLKRLLQEANSIRQAVALVRTEEEKKHAMRSNHNADHTPGNPNTGRRQPKQDRRTGSAAPTTPLPPSDAVRTGLRDAGDALRQIALVDEAAFGRLLKAIQKELRIAKGKAAKKNAEDQDKGV